MREIREKLLQRVCELMAEGKIARVLAWEQGERSEDRVPALFDSVEELRRSFCYDEFCGPNLSKFCIRFSKEQDVTAVILKPCDTLSFRQLLNEHRLEREKFYVIGAGCKGMNDADGLLLKCKACKGKNFVLADEVIDDEESRLCPESNRFEEVTRLENLTAEERFAFWRGELSRCIRCNACRNVCPACSCRTCVFDSASSGVGAKANVTDFEENLFHIIRAYHVAGRCTDCGECSRVCPQHIPLHLLNRKFIKDMNELYGEYQAGEGSEERTPLTSYTKQDPEPGIVKERGNA